LLWVIGVALRCPKCLTPSVLSADEVGAEGRLTCCEACGTSWLARQIHEEKLRQALRALPRQPLIIEGELAPRRLMRPAPRHVERLLAADVAKSASRVHGRPTEPRSPIRPASDRRIDNQDIAANRAGAGMAPRRTGLQEMDRPGWHAGRRRLGPVLFAFALTVIAAFAAPTVTALPGLAEIWQTDALAFAGVKSTFLALRGEPAIVVEGELRNTGSSTVAVPAIRVSLRNAAGEEVFSWSIEPAMAELAAGSSLGFRSALASPAAGGDHVALSLAERAGATVGMR